MDTWQGITISELLTGRRSIVIAKDTIKLFHQTLRVLYSDPEPESFRGVDSEDLFAAFSTTPKTLEGIVSEKKKEETPGANLVGPTFCLQQTRAMHPDKLHTPTAEAPQLQKPYKRHQVLEWLPYLEQIGSAPVINAPTTHCHDRTCIHVNCFAFTPKNDVPQTGNRSTLATLVTPV